MRWDKKSIVGIVFILSVFLGLFGLSLDRSIRRPLIFGYFDNDSVAILCLVGVWMIAALAFWLYTVMMKGIISSPVPCTRCSYKRYVIQFC